MSWIQHLPRLRMQPARRRQQTVTGPAPEVIHHMTIRDTELLIVGSDYAYVIEDPYAVSGPLLRDGL